MHDSVVPFIPSAIEDLTARAVIGSQKRALIPRTKPADGEQYRFVVEMDSCSGCKSCVTACHSLNGLDRTESFRRVGQVQATAGEAFFQTLTSACHHCVDPLCLKGCPVIAYSKDPVTGIVKHLDDQCIGCQYCLFTCPYEVPSYNGRLGIVRKCDMCSHRLEAGEAPACVQACPTEAIRIETVAVANLVSASNSQIPDAPSPTHSRPTTEYRSARGFPIHLEASGKYQSEVQHPHMSLAIMLILSQMVIGSLTALIVIQHLFGLDPRSNPLATVYISLFALHGIGLTVAGLHPGRPLLGFRAILGWRTSWMSREIIAFGIFSGFFAVHLTLLLLGWAVPVLLEGALLATGFLSVFSSIQIYASTPRLYWSWIRTGPRFGGTFLLAGLSTAILFMLLTDLGHPKALLQLWVLVLVLKIGIETSFLRHAYKIGTHESLRRAAAVQWERLRVPLVLRLGLAGLACFCTLVVLHWGAAAIGLSLVATVGLFISELIERRIFFQSAAPLAGAWS